MSGIIFSEQVQKIMQMESQLPIEEKEVVKCLLSSCVESDIQVISNGVGGLIQTSQEFKNFIEKISKTITKYFQQKAIGFKNERAQVEKETARVHIESCLIGKIQKYQNSQSQRKQSQSQREHEQQLQQLENKTDTALLALKERHELELSVLMKERYSTLSNMKKSHESQLLEMYENACSKAFEFYRIHLPNTSYEEFKEMGLIKRPELSPLSDSV